MTDHEIQSVAEWLRGSIEPGTSATSILVMLRDRKLGRIDTMTVLRRAFGLEIDQMQSVMWWHGWGTSDAEFSDAQVESELGPFLALHRTRLSE